jgi:hypothetical protein
MCYIYDENTSQYEVVIGAEISPIRSCYTAYFICRYPVQGGTFLLLASSSMSWNHGVERGRVE